MFAIQYNNLPSVHRRSPTMIPFRVLGTLPSPSQRSPLIGGKLPVPAPRKDSRCEGKSITFNISCKELSSLRFFNSVIKHINFYIYHFQSRSNCIERGNNTSKYGGIHSRELSQSHLHWSELCVRTSPTSLSLPASQLASHCSGVEVDQFPYGEIWKWNFPKLTSTGKKYPATTSPN